MSERTQIVLVANTRVPSKRAQSLQVVQMACALARRSQSVVLLHARRRPLPGVEPEAVDPFTYYAVPEGPRAEIRAVPCVDWIDLVPRPLQFPPARLQELSFSRRAADLVAREYSGSLALCREIEVAHRLSSSGRGGVFLELHRVPGGRLRRRWLRKAGETVAGIFAISGGVRADLLELGLPAESIHVEHDGFDSARFDPLPSRVEARERLGLAADDLVVVYTGGLLAWKGVEVLVDAARSLPGVRFLIAGGMDADRERIGERASGLANVRLDGFQAPNRIPDYLAAADLGVVPNRSRPAISSRYTSPLKVFEAMAVGLPLVASDLPSLREVLDGESEALFVRPDDPAALAEGIERLLAQPERRLRMAAALRARAWEFTWDRRAQRMLDWMEGRLGVPV